MSKCASVFFNSGMALKETIHFLSHLFQVSFACQEDPPLYEHTGLDFAILLYEEHGLEDDGELLFSRYQYQLTILNRYPTAAHAGEIRRYMALYLFHQLLRCQFPSMVVEGVQVLLDRWGDPKNLPLAKEDSMHPFEKNETTWISLEREREIYAYISIFFSSGVGVEETISLLSQLFAISFVYQEDPSCYCYPGLDFSILVYDKHTNEEQKNLRLKQYQYEMRVLNRFVPVPYAYELKKHMALYLFNRLIEEHEFPALVTNASDAVLEEWGEPRGVPVVRKEESEDKSG